MAGDEVRYTAFLSYSHKDAAVARWLHRQLEGYRLPRRLAGTAGERGTVPARLTPIFRDREELPAAGDLSEKVRAALAASDNLIVICSPHAAASPWVGREICAFRDLHPDRPIFAAIVAGDPEQSFHPDLRCLSGGAAIEPLAADLRPEGDGRRLGFLKLVAGLAGVGLDALVQRDAQRRLRRVTAVTLGSLAGMLVMTVLAIFALSARAEAERQRAEAEGLVEYMLTDLRDRLEGVGRLDVLTSVNRRALEYYQGQDLDALPPDSLERRARILHAMGEDEEKRGNLARALALFREAARTTAVLLAAAPDNPERIFSHSQSEYWLGRIDEQRGNYGAALAAYRRYHQHALLMNRLAPANPRYVGELGYSESNLGIVNLGGLKRPQVAREHFERSIRAFLRAAKMQPENKEWLAEAADGHAWLADTWFSQKQYAAARAERLKEQHLKLALVRSDPNNRAYLYASVITARSLARIDRELDAHERALATLVWARRTMDELLRHDSDNLLWRDQATRIEVDLAELYLARREVQEARIAFARAGRLLQEGNKKGAESSQQRKALESRLGALALLINQEHDVEGLNNDH